MTCHDKQLQRCSLQQPKPLSLTGQLSLSLASRAVSHWCVVRPLSAAARQLIRSRPLLIICDEQEDCHSDFSPSFTLQQQQRSLPTCRVSQLAHLLLLPRPPGPPLSPSPMSLTATDVRNQLSRMGYHDELPDDIAAQFAVRLAERARDRGRQQQPQQRRTAAAPTPTLTAAASPLSDASNRHHRQHHVSPQAGRPVQEDEEAAGDAECAGDSDLQQEKENIAQLLSIQRGLTRILQERGIVSPLKQPHHTASPRRSIARSPQRILPPPAEPSSVAFSRPASALSCSSQSSSASRSSCSSSLHSAAPLSISLSLQLRASSRLRGEERGFGAGGYRKTDVVTRYLQYTADWQQSRFLQRRRQCG